MSSSLVFARRCAYDPWTAVRAATGYFTIWSLLLVLFAPEAVARPAAAITAVGGFYLVYIYPRRLIVLDHIFAGVVLLAIDALLHQLPLLCLLRRHGRRCDGTPFLSSARGIGAALLLFGLYVAVCGDPRRRYRLRPVDLAPVTALVAAALLLFART
jgi:hypothetical protein